MAFVTNILAPLIQALVYTLFIGGIGYMIYKKYKASCKNIRWFWKYKVLKRKYGTEVANFCFEAHRKKQDPISLKKELYLKGIDFKETDELLYVYNLICKELEGGAE